MKRLYAFLAMSALLTALAAAQQTAVPVESRAPTELPARRTARSATWDNHDGTRTVRVYPVRKHYREGEAWRAVSLDEREDFAAGYTRAVTAGPYVFRHDPAEPGKGCRFERGGYYVTYTPAGEWTGKKVSFASNGDGVKETVMLAAADDSVVSWRINTNGTAALTGGVVRFADADGDFLSRIPPAAAWDSEGRNVPVTVRLDDGELTYSLSFDALTVFPVTLDPTTTVDDTDDVTGYVYNYDNVYYSTARSDTSGSAAWSTGINLGQKYETGGKWWLYRAFLTFDTSDLPDCIEITSVKLYNVWGNDFSETDFYLLLTKGTFSGPIHKDWYNDFAGWSPDNVAYSWTPISDTRISSASYALGDTLVHELNAYGRATAVSTTGPTRFAMISHRDSSKTAPSTNPDFDRELIILNDDAPYLEITYVTLVAQPANFTMTALDSVTIACSWDDSSDNEDNFVILSLPDSTVLATLPADATADTLAGLGMNTEHIWTVAADSAGVRAFSAPDTAWTLLSTPRVEDVTIRPLSSDTLRVAVVMPANGTEGQTGLEVDAVTGYGADDSGWLTGTYSYDNGGLDPDSSYVYRLRFRNGGGAATDWSPAMVFVMGGRDSLVVYPGGDLWDDYAADGTDVRDSTAVRAGASDGGVLYDGFFTFDLPREVQSGGVDSVRFTAFRTDEAAATTPMLTMRGITDGDLDPVETVVLDTLGTTGGSVSWTVDSGSGERASPDIRSLIRAWQDLGDRYGFSHGFGLKLGGDGVAAGTRAVLRDASHPSYDSDTRLTIYYTPGAPDTLIAAPGDFLMTVTAADSISAQWTDTTVREYGFVLLNATDSTMVAGTDTLAAGTESADVGELTPNTIYSWFVRAFTAHEDSSSGSVMTRTFARMPGAGTVEAVSEHAVRFVIDPQDNPPSTKFAVQDSLSGKYVDGTADPDTLRAGPPGDWGWRTYLEWGAALGDTLGGVSPDSLIVIRAKARNGD